MKIIYFEIKNFKGINHTKIELSGTPGSIYTLVGLNESGKTTILEAINYFSADTDGVHALAQKNHLVEKVETLVPKKHKSNFNGEVSVTAGVKLNLKDKAQIKKHFEESYDSLLNVDSIPDLLTINRRSIFEKSAFKKVTNTWAPFSPSILRNNENEEQETLVLSDETEEWNFLANYVRSLLPRIVYFPTFLFEFPEKIQISDGVSTVEGNEYFKAAINDALYSIDPALNLKEHIIDRVLEVEKGSPFANFFAKWFGSDEKERVDAVLSQLSSKLSKEIFGKWKSVLGSDIGNKELDIQIDVQGGSGNNREVFLTLSVKDGYNKFKISERSLGFRWFFCFLLFTRFFRVADGQGAIFLFDEPASNLHSLAQSKLLDSLKDVAQNTNDIIYSTHSHYLINPLWLETAFIVMNGEVKDTIIDVDFGVEDMDIKVRKYKTFVGENSENGHYFQPILDQLEIEPSLLQLVSNAVIVEGKSDFYILNWYKKYHNPDLDINFVPVGSVFKAAGVISLYLGLARKFVFLHDNDPAGHEARRQYLEALPLSQSQLVSINEPFTDSVKAIESLISSNMKTAIRDKYGATRCTKKLILRAFSESLSGNNDLPDDQETILNLRKITDLLVSKTKT